MTQRRLHPPGYQQRLREDQDRGTDHGCDLFDACLTCPLPACRYDHDNPVTATHQKLVWQIDQLLQREHLTDRQIAERIGCSARTVYRILNEPRPRFHDH